MHLSSLNIVVEKLDIAKCNCSAQCKTYGFKQGTFYQGCGFDRSTAIRIERSYNACASMDDPKEIVEALISLAKDVALSAVHAAPLAYRSKEILSHIKEVR